MKITKLSLDQLQWRPQTIHAKSVLMMPYVSADVFHEILTEACPLWQLKLRESEWGVTASITIMVEDKFFTREAGADWKTKKDKDGKFEINKKATETDAFKRACRSWGICKELDYVKEVYTPRNEESPFTVWDNKERRNIGIIWPFSPEFLRMKCQYSKNKQWREDFKALVDKFGPQDTWDIPTLVEFLEVLG